MDTRVGKKNLSAPLRMESLRVSERGREDRSSGAGECRRGDRREEPRDSGDKGMDDPFEDEDWPWESMAG
jgi:hypothetical protein